MEAGKKRKANALSSSDGSASKKLKLLNSNPPPAAAWNKVQESGFKLIEQLRKASDKTGRLIGVEFLTLPPKDELPDYYAFTRLPIAIDTIERKLQRNAYPTMTTLESDLKRMVQNAKDYNAPKSDIYEDAERIRKLAYNFFKVHNAAYETDPNYTAFATPITAASSRPVLNGTHEDDNMEDVQHEPQGANEKPKKLVLKASEPPSERKASVAPSGTTGNEDVDEVDEGGDGTDIDFAGKSFQDAQQMILAHLLHYTDDEGLEIYSPFANLPSRKLEDYYKLIRHPVCLKGVAKRTRGIHGRALPTSITDFKTWDHFAEEVSYIWRNAQDYNEDGSDMYSLANEFKEHFQTLLTDAKDKTEEPSGPRLKLGGPKPKVTLNLNQHRASPAPGVHVDNAALLRQKQMVQAGVNGHQQQRSIAPTGLTNGIRSSTNGPVIEPRPHSSANSSSPGAAVKTEKLATQSPALNHAQLANHPQTNGMFPPPVPRASGSPFTAPAVNSYTYTAPSLLPPTALRSYPVESALLPTVTIATHPQLKISNPLKVRIPPHSTLSQQSTTVTLPSTHYFLQISPTISKQLSMGRPYKMFVAVNGTRLNQRDTQFHADTGRRTHVYEGSLAQGVNRVEVEVAAAKEGGDGKGLDVEKVTVFAHLMK